MNMYSPSKGETLKSSRSTPISSPVQNNRVGEWIKSSTIFPIIRSLFGVLQLQFEMLGRKEAASPLVISSDLLAAAWCQRCVEQSVPEPLASCFHLHIPALCRASGAGQVWVNFQANGKMREGSIRNTLYTSYMGCPPYLIKSWRKWNHFSTAPCVCTLGSTSRA